MYEIEYWLLTHWILFFKFYFVFKTLHCCLYSLMSQLRNLQRNSFSPLYLAFDFWVRCKVKILDKHFFTRPCWLLGYYENLRGHVVVSFLTISKVCKVGIYVMQIMIVSMQINWYRKSVEFEIKEIQVNLWKKHNEYEWMFVRLKAWEFHELCFLNNSCAIFELKLFSKKYSRLLFKNIYLKKINCVIGLLCI